MPRRYVGGTPSGPGLTGSRRTDNEHSRIVTVGTVAPGWNEESPVRLQRTIRVTTLLLKYVVPGSTYAAQVAVETGSPLDALRHLAEGLARAHGWEEAQTATFALTGMTPVIGLVRATEGGTSIRDGVLCAWNERIILDVHPGVSPAELTEIYRCRAWSARSRANRAKLTITQPLGAPSPAGGIRGPPRGHVA